MLLEVTWYKSDSFYSLKTPTGKVLGEIFINDITDKVDVHYPGTVPPLEFDTEEDATAWIENYLGVK